MGGTLVVEILLGILTVFVTVATFLGASRAGQRQATGTLADIDAKAYDRAKGIYESAIDTLEDQITHVREQMAMLDAEVEKLQNTNQSLIRQVFELQATNRSLTVQVSELKRSNDQLLEELRKKN